MTTTDELLRNGNQVLADLHTAIAASKRARLCPECAGNPNRAIQQDCESCAVEGDKPMEAMA